MSHTINKTDLLALREVFAQLGEAIAVSDLATIEASTEALRGFVTQSDAHFLPEHRGLIEDIDLISEDVAHSLASRLRAYDLAITAWREAEGDR